MKKNNTLKSLVIASLTTLALAGSAYGQILVTDTFENRADGSDVELTTTSGPNSPNNWIWQGMQDSVIGDDNGNKFADLTGQGISAATWGSTQYSSSRIALDSEDKYKFSYDLLWLQDFGGVAGHGINVNFNIANKFAYVSAADPEGYTFSVWASDINEAGYRLRQMVEGEAQDIASGTVTFAGIIDASSDSVAGNALPVEIIWQGNTIALSLNGVTVFDSVETTFTPNAENAAMGANTYLTLTSNTYRAKGIDNISLSTIPEVASSSLLLGLSALCCGFLRRRK